MTRLDVRPVGAAVAMRHRARRMVLVLPAIVLGLLVLFTAFGVSGTSSPLLAPDGGGPDTLIVGTARTIRSDEWMVHTPLVVSQVRNGSPRYGDVGVGSHDMSVLSDLPVRDWTMAFRPHQWGYLVLPLDNAYAFEWWSVAAILILGMYAFLLSLTRSVRWSAVGAVLLFASPFLHWWHTASAFATIGWMALAATCLLAAVDAGRVPSRLSWSVACAYALVCFALVLYPPWQISVAIAVGVVVLGPLWTRWREGRLTLRPAAMIGAVAAVGAAIPLGLFYVTRRPALAAIAHTVYPGARVVGGGSLSIDRLFTSWFGIGFLRNGPAMRGSVVGNESEASSFLFLGIVLLIALPLVWRFVAPFGDRLRATIIATVVAMALLLTHVFVGLPSIISRVTLLSTVPEQRALIGLGLASVVLVVLVGLSLEHALVPRASRVLAGIVLTVATVAGVLTLAKALRESGAPIGRWTFGIAILVALVAAGLFFWRAFLSAIVLTTFGLLVSLPVNPLVDGLSQTTESDLVLAVREAAASGGTADAWMAESYELGSLVTTAGVANISGVNLYPNVPAWRILDPTGRYEDVWNRYAQAVWRFEPNRTAPEIRLVQEDMIEVFVDPCDPVLDRFAIGHVVTPRQIDGACLGAATEVRGPAGDIVRIYPRASTATSLPDAWTVR